MCRNMGALASCGVWLCLVTFAHASRTVLREASHQTSSVKESPQTVNVTVDLSIVKPVSPLLYGIFFEEIGHAGEGGLYAEMVQDRSFDALALASSIHETDATSIAIDVERINRQINETAGELRRQRDAFIESKKAGRPQTIQNAAASPMAIYPAAWYSLPGTELKLTTLLPLNPDNKVALQIINTHNGTAGVINSGYWGINVEAYKWYHISLYARQAKVVSNVYQELSVSLVNFAGDKVYASKTIRGISTSWHHFNATLVPRGSDTNARLLVSFEGPGEMVVDVVSMFPAANIRSGYLNPWPFREDLLQALKDLQPKFVRFPGGCYVEGNVLANRFQWKKAIGPISERPGHLSDVWRYWSTDGLGLFEYMLLCEELGAEPVWVINNGVSHQQSVPVAQIWPYVQDALDSVEFVTGSPTSKWGAVRARMGHPDPWELNYLAIGNEDCWKPQYLENYRSFYAALRARYPHLKLIANCDMGATAITEIWDYHVYTDPVSLFNLRNVFNGWTPAAHHDIFASEYAVTTGGGWGNLEGAVAEAAFMTGLERNSQVVKMAAYAPLFTHANDRVWSPDMIVFDNHRSYVIPSYWVQKAFTQHQGVLYAETQVVTYNQAVHRELVAASATCLTVNCTTVAVKVVNTGSYSQTVNIKITGGEDMQFESDSSLWSISGSHPEAENSFDEPYTVSPRLQAINTVASSFSLDLQPYSVNILNVTLSDNTTSSVSPYLQDSMSSAIS